VSVTLDDALDALSAVARKCDVCEKHRATRTGRSRRYDFVARVCDRYACGHVVVCAACGCGNRVPATTCDDCGAHPIAAVEPRAEWTDLPHAAALRAANARRS
jgi:predicted RNA methylase